MSVAGQRKLMVLLTSVDGHHKHPFDADDTVGAAHDLAYKKLVRQKDQIPFDRTWMEQEGVRRENSQTLGSLVTEPRGGSEPDLSLSIVWETAGGRSRDGR